MPAHDPFGARTTLGPGLPDYYRLAALGSPAVAPDGLPMTVRILLENALRHAGGGVVRTEDVETLLGWRPGSAAEVEIPFMPSRVILQDFTGVPAVVDLAAMRDAMVDLGGDPAAVNPLVPADLVIDHSVQVDAFGTPAAFAFNVEREYERNGERYGLLRWAQTAFRDLRVVPPGTGIVHQVNLEHLATVVTTRADGHGPVAFPDTLVGTDSHTTMINGLGVLGYGVGGIEAEAVLLGQPLYQPMPRVVGRPARRRAAPGLDRDRPRPGRDREAARVRGRRSVRRVRRRRAGRAGPGRPGDDRQHEPRVRGDLDPLPDRRRDPGLPPPHRSAGRARRARRALRPGPGAVARAGRGARLRRPPRARPGLDRAVGRRPAPTPGPGDPGRPAGELPGGLPADRRRGGRERDGRGWTTRAARPPDRPSTIAVEVAGTVTSIRSGSVAIAAITSCTNTSNPTVMVGAGLLARNAVARGLTGRPDGEDLAGAGLQGGHRLPRGSRADGAPGDSRLRPGRLRLHHLHRQLGPARRRGRRGDRGQRPGRRRGPLGQPQLRGPDPSRSSGPATSPRRRSSSRSPWPGGSTSTSPASRSGSGDDGRPVFLADLWPSGEEIRRVIGTAISPDLFRRTYASVFEGDERWRALPVPAGDRFAWDPASTYIARPPFLEGLGRRGRRRRRHQRGAGAGRPRRLGHDRPHLAGRLDRRLVAGRPLAPGARRPAARVQLLRGAARPARGDDPRDVRQHPAAQPPRRGAGRPIHRPPARRRGRLHLRRRPSATTRRASRSWSSPAASTARARRGTGRPRAPGCSGCGRSSRRATSGSIARTWSGWASCRSSSCPVRVRRRSA